ncbi:MAG: BrnA antitoxin family protein [Methylocystis sp.]
MNASKKSTHQDFDIDDAPDLSTPEWQAKFAAAPVKRGRPPVEAPKVSTTIRLDADILEAFRKDGHGWQSRINAALREWIAATRASRRSAASSAAATRQKPATIIAPSSSPARKRREK